MPISQNIVGAPAASGNNAIVSGRAGQLGDVIVSELHGRYYKTNYRGAAYFGGHSAVGKLAWEEVPV
jgi:hypothetical protein